MWREYEPAIILLCVRWYCRYQLSYHDLEEMMRERGLSVGHTTIFRWARVRACLGYRSFDTAERTIQEVEAMNIVRKGQLKKSIK
jgi:transposase-like protein